MTSSGPAPFGHYSPATVTPDGTIWVSAQLPVGTAADSPITQQTRQALLNVLSVAESFDGQLEGVAKVNLYLTDIADWEAVDTTFGEVFGEHRPARTVLQVAGLHHGFRVAADAVCWRNDGRE